MQTRAVQVSRTVPFVTKPPSFCAFLAAALVATLLAPLAANAATVSVSYEAARATLTVTAGEGEANRVTVELRRDAMADAWSWLVTDTGARLLAGDGCTSVDEHSASCPARVPDSAQDPWHGTVAIALGDGDDWASAAGGCLASPHGVHPWSCYATLDGGAGDDTLFAVELFEVGNDLSGGAGNDVLHGHGDLRGGPGDDRLLAYPYDGQEATFQGGPGADTMIGDAYGIVDYSDRGNAVFVTLNNKLRDDGEKGENDLVLNVPEVYGGAGNDVLVGTERADWISGNGGSDTVRGKGGGDAIYGDGGEDALYGGRGDDDLVGDVNSGTRCDDRSSASGGDDRLYGGGGSDWIRGCGGDDLVHGGPARDVMSGSAGADRLVGGRGRDNVHAGAGNDTLSARDGYADRLVGWRGSDRARIDPGLDVTRSIERRF
jgi:Ca2+-binding RTX toxin-like protein